MLDERTYKEWAAKDLWTIEEAIKLIIGHEPEFKLNGQHCRDELHLSQFEEKFDNVFEQRNERYHEIEELVRRALQAGSITIIAQPNQSADFSSYNNEFDDEGVSHSISKRVLKRAFSNIFFGWPVAPLKISFIPRLAHSLRASSSMPSAEESTKSIPLTSNTARLNVPTSRDFKSLSNSSLS